MRPRRLAGIFGAAYNVWAFTDAAVLAMLLAGCVTGPTAQIQYFGKAFDAVNTVGQPLLDDLSVGERQLGLANAAAGKPCPHATVTSGGSSVLLGFCNDEAGIFSNQGDPPATEKFRGGLAVLHSFVDLLISLSSGASAADAVAQVNLLSQQISSLVGTVTGPAGTAGISTALTALQPLLKQVANQLAVEEVRAVILQADPLVANLIDALANSAPYVFDTVARSTQLRLGQKNSPTFLADKAKYESYRTIVSNYVTLLGKLRVAWEQTVAAVKSPAPLSLAQVANSVGQIQAYADATLRVYAVLRTGAAPASP
jgi:hypothetical protein